MGDVIKFFGTILVVGLVLYFGIPVVLLIFKHEGDLPFYPNITAVDSYRFEPPDITVHTYQRHWPRLPDPTVILVNDHSKTGPHRWVLTQDDDHVVADLVTRAATQPNYQPEDDATVLASSPLLGHQPGKPYDISSAYITIPSTPGTYRYLCVIPGHYQAGMHGVLQIVVDP